MINYIAQGLLNANNLPHHNDATQDDITKILNIIFIIVGALAFLMIVIAGLRYVFAQGEPNKIAEAKNMLIYALIGLIIAASAAAIVNFVVVRL
ncbi:MAG TPA: pilin [Candidatus Saccharimonadales bacterium]|nr:pilin [Candidatus Saccharimonadales bacterium]